MSTGTTRAPALPLAPVEYDRAYVDSVHNILRQYFAQLDNPGPSAASTQTVSSTQIVSAMNFSTVDQATQTRVVSLPTQADLSKLRVGDLYRDTSAGNVIKIKV
jgi:hypothetical protein